MSNAINSAIALVIAGIGVYWLYQGQVNDSIATPPLYYIKFGGATLLGLGMLAYNAFPLLKNFQFTLPPFPKPVENTDMTKDLGTDIQIKTDEEKDMTAIYYLTERCKTVGNGLELCKQLNDLFFDLHHGPKKAE